MTSQSDRIQSLVDQINTILHDASVDGEPMVDEYQVLAQTRQRLIQLQGPSLPPIVAASMETTETAIAVQNWHAPAPALAESAQQVLQSIVQEMAYLRMNTVQPLREEIVRLQQERNYLASEVQQLQHQRYQLVLAQQTDQQQMINGFLHALMERLQEQLALQVAQTIAKLEGRTGTTLVSAGDAKVMQLDSTLQVVFDSLQSNINVHQAALEASLQKMQGLGQQGEAMFTAFVNRLASRLGQEASQYLQPGTPGEPPFNPSAVPGEPSVAGADAFASVSSEDSFYELSDLPLPLDQTTVDFPISPFNQPIVAVHEDGSEETPLAMGGLDSVVDGIMLGETGFDASPAMLGSAAWPDDGITEDWPDPAVDQSLDPLLDQVIDDLESEAIAPLDALEVVDNLDLGFDLEAVELADVPADKTALSALLQESDDASKVFDPDPLSLRDLAQGDTSRNDPRYRIDDSTEDQGNEDQSNEDDGMSPMVLSPPEGLSAPLQPITTLQLDNDDIDVDRLLNVINASADEPGVDLTEPVEAENWTESGPDDVSLLRQELAAELQDELIDEQLFGASETVPLPEDIFPTVDAPPAMSQSDSGISFTINAPRATVEPEGRVDENILDDGEPETWTPGGSESDSPDFYGAFVDSIEPGYFSDSAPEPESELESELESGLGVELGSEAEAEVEEGDRLFMVDEPPVAPPDQPEGATTGGLMRATTGGLMRATTGGLMRATTGGLMRATTGGLPLQDDLPVALEGNHGGIALTSDLLAAEDEPTMAPASDTADGWEFSNSSDPSPPEIGADRTGDAEPPTADDGISDSWSQWIDDAEVSSSTLPELDESDDANLSAWLESDTPEGPTADLSPVADIINRLTDLVQDFPTGGGTGEDDPSAPDDLTAMFEEEDRSVDPLFPVTSMADDSPNDGADDEADDLLMGDRYGVDSDPWSDQETGDALSSEATLQDHDWMEEPVADLFGDEPVSSTPDPLGGSAAPLFGDLAGEPADPDPEVDTEDPPSVAAMLDDFFSGDSLTDEPPAPAQAIAKPIGSGFISDSLDESESSDESTSLFDQFEQPDGDDDGALLFVESLESESLDSLQDHISDFGSEFIADSFDESDSSEEAASLFDQFEQPVDPPDAEEDGVSLFAESSEDFPLDLLQDEMGAPSGDDGFSSLLEGLQEEDGASGALTDAEEAKTLADLLRSQKAYFVQPAAAPESDESRAVPPAVPSDSDPFSNWFGSDGEDAEETGDAQKKNNG